MELKRTCMSCTACCTYLRIESQPGYTTRYDTGEDIAKAAGIPCRYLTEKGCGIYEVRPQLCRKFQCDWIQGRKGFTKKDAPHLKKSFSISGDIFYFS